VTGIHSIFGNLTRRLRKTARRLRRDARKGSAAIEFAVIAPVFFILLMGIIENGVIYFAGSTLQYATDNAARYVRTGQAQTASMTQAQFRTMICNDITPLLACDSNLQIDMEAYTGYASATFTSPTTPTGGLNPALDNYQLGSACSVVLVRTFYTWQVLTPGLSQFLTNITGGYHLITATSAFRNEPFTSSISGC
jgi:Flp pilus assembly protein TadG